MPMCQFMNGLLRGIHAANATYYHRLPFRHHSCVTSENRYLASVACLAAHPFSEKFCDLFKANINSAHFSEQFFFSFCELETFFHGENENFSVINNAIVPWTSLDIY